ncbi:MAG: hypothetical protein IK130_09270 [Oscillospiraceae bacterium]|nr:hypothetical protein [Oscillospiraceae bacterium]
MLREILCEKLDPRSGEILPPEPQNDPYWRTALEIVWKGGIRFEVVESLVRRGLGHYDVLRDGQRISPDYVFTKTDDALFRIFQGMIDDIEAGKYRNKKTLREKVRLLAEEKGLVSYMNDTKWRELFGALREQAPDVQILYKTLFEENAPTESEPFSADETLAYVPFAEIEWLKIAHVVTEWEHIGVLVPPVVRTQDKKDTVLRILEQYHIPYAYDEAEQVFVIYGYK